VNTTTLKSNSVMLSNYNGLTFVKKYLTLIKPKK